MTMKRCLLIIVSLALLLVGCSSKPSEADARKVFDQRVEKSVKAGVIKINHFKKVNGVMSPDEHYYTLEWEAETEYLVDTEAQLPRMNPLAFERAHKKGEREKLTGSYQYERTDNGWRYKAG